MGDMIEIFKAATAKRLEPETIIQINRIAADSGVVIDPVFMNNVIKLLKSLEIYGNAKLLTDANFGVKKDGSGAVSKLYDISGNNNDAIESTGASQPIWSLVNGKGVIAYNGSKYMTLGIPASLNFAPTDAFSVMTKTSYVSGTGYVITKYSGSAGAPFAILRSASGISYGRPYSTATIQGINSLLNGSSVIVCPATGNATTYFNGVIDITLIRDSVNTTAVTIDWLIGARRGNNNTDAAVFLNGQINSSAIFNIALTQSQITTLYNAGL